MVGRLQTIEEEEEAQKRKKEKGRIIFV